MQYRGPEAQTNEIEAHVALICASTDDGRPLTGGGLLGRFTGRVSGSGLCINGTHKRQKFSS